MRHWRGHSCSAGQELPAERSNCCHMSAICPGPTAGTLTAGRTMRRNHKKWSFTEVVQEGRVHQSTAESFLPRENQSKGLLVGDPPGCRAQLNILLTLVRSPAAGPTEDPQLRLTWRAKPREQGGLSPRLLSSGKHRSRALSQRGRAAQGAKCRGKHSASLMFNVCCGSCPALSP